MSWVPDGSSASAHDQHHADLSLLPLSELPIQTVLHFQAPLPALAVPYLQLVALAEGHMLDADEVENLYVATAAAEAAAPSYLPCDGPLHPDTSFANPDRASGDSGQVTYDLRHAIAQLSVWCQWAVGAERDPMGLKAHELEKWSSTQESAVWSMTSLAGAYAENDDEEGETPAATAPADAPTLLAQLQALRKMADARSFADANLKRCFRRESDVSSSGVGALEPS